MKSYILSILFISFLNILLTAQNIEKTEFRTVISTTGLNMRSLPRVDAKIVTSVPFGEVLEAVWQEASVIDTIGFHDFSWKYEDGSIHEYKEPIDGSWMKVYYKGKQGYMFNSYLAYGDVFSKISDAHKEIMKNYALLYPGNDCYADFHYDHGWFWYGFYIKDNTLIPKEVDVSFFSRINEVIPGECNYVTSTNDNNNLNFIIGSKSPMNLNPIKNLLDRNECHEWHRPKVSNECLEQVNLSFEFDKDAQWGEGKLYLKYKGKTQLLNPKEYEFAYFMGVSWVGDIDGDDKDDYIIIYGEKGGESVLYLSSAAKKGQLVAPVAINYHGYCC